MTTNQTIRFGAWVKAARTSRDMTFDEMASRSGVTKCTVHNVENGKCESCNMSTAKKLASAFGLPLWKVLRAINY